MFANRETLARRNQVLKGEQSERKWELNEESSNLFAFAESNTRSYMVREPSPKHNKKTDATNQLSLSAFSRTWRRLVVRSRAPTRSTGVEQKTPEFQASSLSKRAAITEWSVEDSQNTNISAWNIIKDRTPRTDQDGCCSYNTRLEASCFRK